MNHSTQQNDDVNSKLLFSTFSCLFRARKTSSAIRRQLKISTKKLQEKNVYRFVCVGNSRKRNNCALFWDYFSLSLSHVEKFFFLASGFSLSFLRLSTTGKRAEKLCCPTMPRRGISLKTIRWTIASFFTQQKLLAKVKKQTNVENIFFKMKVSHLKPKSNEIFSFLLFLLVLFPGLHLASAKGNRLITVQAQNDQAKVQTEKCVRVNRLCPCAHDTKMIFVVAISAENGNLLAFLTGIEMIVAILSLLYCLSSACRSMCFFVCVFLSYCLFIFCSRSMSLYDFTTLWTAFVNISCAQMNSSADAKKRKRWKWLCNGHKTNGSTTMATKQKQKKTPTKNDPLEIRTHRSQCAPQTCAASLTIFRCSVIRCRCLVSTFRTSPGFVEIQTFPMWRFIWIYNKLMRCQQLQPSNHESAYQCIGTHITFSMSSNAHKRSA